MIKLQPQGTKLIVHPVEMKNFVTESNLEIVNLDLDMGEVMEVPNELAEIYSIGDNILYSKGAGMSIPFSYNKHIGCLFLDGRGQPNGDIIAIVTNE